MQSCWAQARPLHALHLQSPDRISPDSPIGPYQPKHSFRPYPLGFRLIIDPGPVSHGILVQPGFGRAPPN